MARSRHYLPRRLLDRLPFSSSAEATRRKRKYDDTIKLSAKYLTSLDELSRKRQSKLDVDEDISEPDESQPVDRAAQVSFSTSIFAPKPFAGSFSTGVLNGLATRPKNPAFQKENAKTLAPPNTTASYDPATTTFLMPPVAYTSASHVPVTYTASPYIAPASSFLEPPSLPGQERAVCCGEAFITLDGYVDHRRDYHGDQFYGQAMRT